MNTRREFLRNVGAAALVSMGLWHHKLVQDPDEPVWAWDPPHGLFVGTRRWLPKHLQGQETVGGLHVDFDNVPWSDGAKTLDFRVNHPREYGAAWIGTDRQPT